MADLAFSNGEAELQADISDDIFLLSAPAAFTILISMGAYVASQKIRYTNRECGHATTITFVIVRFQIRPENFVNAASGWAAVSPPHDPPLPYQPLYLVTRQSNSDHNKCHPDP